MSEPSFDVRESVPGRMVEAWAMHPPGSPANGLRAALREAVGSLRAAPGEILRATYTSASAAEVTAEDVLVAGVGADALRAAAVHGLAFERVYSAPSMGFVHHLRYELGPVAGPRHWRLGDVVASARMSVATLGELHRPDAAWSSRGAGPGRRRALPAQARFGVDVVLSGPCDRPPDLTGLLHPVLHGVIAGCQTAGDSDPAAGERCVAGELRWGGRRPGWWLSTEVTELAPLD